MRLLLASEREQWRVTLQSIGDAVVATDVDGAVTFLNPVAEKLTGWTDAESRGHPVTEVMPLFHEETGEPSPNPVQEVLRERIVVAMANHTVLRQRGGREIPIEDSAAPIFAPDGSLRGAIIVFHDVIGQAQPGAGAPRCGMAGAHCAGGGRRGRLGLGGEKRPGLWR